MSIKELSTENGYDLWAPYYEKDGNPMMGLDEIVVNEILGDWLKGKKAVDLGCGTGRHTIKLGTYSAEVIALEISQGMLNEALSKNPPSNIKFVNHDLSLDFPLKSNEFDFILSTLVLEHLQDLNHFFSEIQRISKENSKIFITAMHPAMMLKGTQANFNDPNTGYKIRPKGYPNQISDFINAIQQSKLHINKMNEYFCDEQLIEKFPRAKKYLNWPMLISFDLSN